MRKGYVGEEVEIHRHSLPGRIQGILNTGERNAYSEPIVCNSVLPKRQTAQPAPKCLYQEKSTAFSEQGIPLRNKAGAVNDSHDNG